MSGDNPSIQQHQQQQLQQHQQQQHALSAPTPQQHQQQQDHAAVDNLTCQWLHCGERHESPEALYEHVCERHVGRKSTNNLNLQCHWGSCRTSTVKRDHITSHIRVHVPLKPHKCDFCGKTFKRPQDLKKHVKTHADDSILLNAPNGNSIQPSMASYQQGSSKHAYFNGNGPIYNAYQPNGNGHINHHAAAQAAQTAGNYGSTYYNIPTASAHFGDQGMDTKRGYENLNSLFGDIRRRALEPTSYIDLNRQLGGSLQGLPLPINGRSMFDNESGRDDFSNGPAVAYQQHASHPPGFANAGYSMPFDNLKSKHDLMDTHRFLEQLQATVYDYPRGQPTQAHQMHTGIDPELTDSPPHLPSIAGSARGNSITSETPCLTPGSQMSSHSPASVYSNQNYSPLPRHSNIAYPSLPSVNHAGDVGDMQQHGYSNHGLPPSGLSNPYEEQERLRRYSGGYLQRAQPKSPNDSDPASPNSHDSSSDKGKDVKMADNQDQTQNALPPIKRRETGSSDSSADEKNEAWVENMRTIEALKTYVEQRLATGDFESSEPVEPEQDGQTTPRATSQNQEMVDASSEKEQVYPTLRKVEAAS